MDKEQMSGEFLGVVKRHLKITWEDEDTDSGLLDMMNDTEIYLNHLFGTEIDYSASGMERRIFLNCMLYAYNDCLEQFEDAYRKDILRVRHFYTVKREREKNEEQISNL